MTGKGTSASVRLRRLAAAGLALLFLAGINVPSASANEPRIVNARVVKIGKESYIFEVTVAHADDSWDHYLDKWEVVGPGGKILGTRVLFHPHIGESHFTRAIRGLVVPAGVEHVIIRVHDKVHGYGPEKLVAMPTDANPDTSWK